MKILIGSRALNYWNPNCTITEQTDWDVVSLYPIDDAEFHDQYLLNNADLCRYTSPTDTLHLNGEILHVISLKGLSLIKRSHLHRDLGFQKHVTHYWWYLEPYRNMYDDIDREFLHNRIQMTVAKFPQFQPNLNQSVESFFSDAVVKKYSHDYLHELMAYEESPMYTKLQRDDSLAWCNQDLWYNLTYEQKLRCVAEEVYVIATERFLVLNDWNCPRKLAYMKSLQKVCTTLCSGWFRDFAIDNYPKIIELYDRSKFDSVEAILTKETKNDK
jgi:hypothetical protein